MSGEVVFAERRGMDVRRSLELPCGQCIGCRIERSRRWALRCMHEAKMHDGRNSFVTLTYDDEHLPHRGQLQYRDYQLFMMRLRKEFGPGIRFYMCGEYGPLNWRPHYHACLFGMFFEDRYKWSKSKSGAINYRSATLERLWPLGASAIGDLTFESAAYVARYCVSKVTGFNADAHYKRFDADGEYQLVPEFNKMSLRPGIGATFYEKFKSDMFPRDHVTVNGKKCSVPTYYNKLLEREDPDLLEELKWAREKRSRALAHDNTDARLKVRERVAAARANMFTRGDDDS